MSRKQVILTCLWLGGLVGFVFSLVWSINMYSELRYIQVYGIKSEAKLISYQLYGAHNGSTVLAKVTYETPDGLMSGAIPISSGASTSNPDFNRVVSKGSVSIKYDPRRPRKIFNDEQDYLDQINPLTKSAIGAFLCLFVDFMFFGMGIFIVTQSMQD